MAIELIERLEKATGLNERCSICEERRFIIVDALQVDGCKRRWQWADFGPGINDCPGCVQVPPTTQKCGDPDLRARQAGGDER